MKLKKLLLVGLVLAVLGAAGALYMYNKPHKNYAKIKPAYELSAQQLCDDFEADESAANEKYLNKMVQVNGEIVGVNFDETGRATITLIDPLFGITATFDSERSEEQNAALKKLKTGDVVTLKGRCDGKLTDVQLTQCSLVL